MRSWMAVALLYSACGAPGAETIEGDVAQAIQRGIAEGDESFDHSAWDELVSRYIVDEGRRFDYAGLKEEEERLDAYLETLAEADVDELSAEEIEALFINAYNAYTIHTILDHVEEDGTYRIESIRDIENVFGREVHVVGGFRLSLDNIEHNILRPIFRDPRVHFAVNCASISCPPLPPNAFTGENLDAGLEAATKRTLGDPDYASVEDDTLVLTKILDWYGSDFTNPEYQGSEESLAAFVRKYASDEVRGFLDRLEERGNDVRVRFRDYDWALNRPVS